MTEVKFTPQEFPTKTDFSDDHHSASSRHLSKEEPQFGTQTINCIQPTPTLRSCAQCGKTQTPQWRNGPKGPRTLCNACGIRLHRRNNKIKMGTIPRRRKKTTTKAISKTPRQNAAYAIPYGRYIKSKGIQSGARDHNSDVVYLGRKSRKKGVESGGLSFNGGISTRPRSQRLRSRRIREMNANAAAAAAAVGLNRTKSFRCEDFTAAIDLLSLSKERYRLIGKSLDQLPNRYECLKSEVGVTDKDLLACYRALPRSSAPDFKRYQSELVNAQFEVQAAEMGAQTVAEILTECSEEMARKRSRYWEARSQLETFIIKQFKSATQLSTSM
eukprot:g5578.t1